MLNSDRIARMRTMLERIAECKNAIDVEEWGVF